MTRPFTVADVAAPGGDGRRERHARLVLRRRSLPRPGRGDRARPGARGGRGRGARRRRRVDPARRAIRSTLTKRLRRVVPVVRALVAPTNVPVSIDTTKARGGCGRARCGRDDRERRLGRRRRSRHAPTWSPSAEPGSSRCTCGARRGRCSTTRSTTTSSREVGAHFAGARRRRGRGRVSRATRSSSIPASGSARRSRTTSHCLRALPRIAATAGVPVVVGTSRKSFLGHAARRAAGRRARRSDARDDGVVPSSRARPMVRVHDVARLGARRRVCST